MALASVPDLGDNPKGSRFSVEAVLAWQIWNGESFSGSCFYRWVLSPASFKSQKLNVKFVFCCQRACEPLLLLGTCSRFAWGFAVIKRNIWNRADWNSFKMWLLMNSSSSLGFCEFRLLWTFVLCVCAPVSALELSPCICTNISKGKPGASQLSALQWNRK